MEPTLARRVEIAEDCGLALVALYGRPPDTEARTAAWEAFNAALDALGVPGVAQALVRSTRQRIGVAAGIGRDNEVRWAGEIVGADMAPGYCFEGRRPA